MLHKVIINVSGRVQGVGFRYFTLETARRIEGITGFVKNLPNGSVEIEAEGTKEKLEKFIEEIKKGPPLSRIKDITLNWLTIEKRQKNDFTIEI